MQMIPAFQQTVKSAATVSGIGQHSGVPANMTVRPAPADSGIVFIRTDVQDKDNIIPARYDAVSQTQLCTVVANKAGVSVSTVEHILSACAAAGIDNAVIEIDGPEIPILDSSTQGLLALLDTAGIKKLSAPRRVLRVKKPVSYEENGKKTMLTPADFRVFNCEIVYDSPVIGTQKMSYRLDIQSYRESIAPARNWAFMHEVEQLRKMGLAKGGSLENSIVIEGEKVLNPEGLRFRDEFVRHKILDAIGDLYLCGFQIIGAYHGHKGGHAMNNKLLRALFAEPEAYEIVTLAEPAKAPRRPAVYAEAGLVTA